MYTILDTADLLTFAEIKAEYDGKWVFMTNCEFSEGYYLERAIPRVIADTTLEGLDEGVYDIYKNKGIYGETTDFSFYDKSCLIKSISFVGGSTNVTSNISI